MTKPDLYTKAVLTIIALLLAVIACNQLVNPHAVAEAQGALTGMQFSAVPGAFDLFDPRSGEVTSYSTNTGKAFQTVKLNK